jgi:hypothetical protein
VESEGSRRQNAGLTNRKRIEAVTLDKKANIFKVQYLYGKRDRICDRHKREGGCALPGEICQSAARLLRSRGCGMDWQKSAEAIVKYIDRTEGPNVTERQEP